MWSCSAHPEVELEQNESFHDETVEGECTVCGATWRKPSMSREGEVADFFGITRFRAYRDKYFNNMFGVKIESSE